MYKYLRILLCTKSIALTYRKVYNTNISKTPSHLGIVKGAGRFHPTTK